MNILSKLSGRIYFLYFYPPTLHKRKHKFAIRKVLRTFSSTKYYKNTTKSSQK